MTIVERYKKWFDLNGMDFEVLWMNGAWTVSAWPRDGENMAYGWSGQKATLDEAIHTCYINSKESLALRRRDY